MARTPEDDLRLAQRRAARAEGDYASAAGLNEYGREARRASRDARDAHADAARAEAEIEANRNR